ncbi:thiamine phosphate synthase [Allosphingosinicella vermicomposti]|uniref:thiamine phosphate synthase n=1 Tax=Allosphingosinicella vermicomposti TaxID=614671 RepID=UPI000D0FEFBC|nr:thiamine phosphate synthase [Allosphingosinicella vermicomposti]
MMRRQPLPRVWMMTDERQGDALWAALDRLPRGAGVVFRHYALPLRERRRLFERMKKVARRRGLLLVAAKPEGLRLHSAVGVHNHKRHVYSYVGQRPVMTAAVHNMRELRRAQFMGADLIFVSPIFPTRSHPDARSLGIEGFSRLARAARVPVIALGGMDGDRYRELRRHGAYGWAGIDAWICSGSPRIRQS